MIEQILDTRVLLLFLQDDPALPPALASRIEDQEYRSLISMATLWELAEKQARGLLTFEAALRPDFPGNLLENGFEIIPLDWATMRRAASLPWHHHDSIDRLLIAEAIARNIPILSLDPRLGLYDVACLGV